MGMSREEAIEIFEQKGWWIAQKETLTSKQAEEIIKLNDAVNFTLTALRPVSREQVEKVWRGCEKCNGAGEYSRYAENLTKILLAKYCPHCGRPLTDEAVEMVMERWKEAVSNG